MTTDPHHERRWLILAVLGLAQLMVILDVTVVNIALPSAQHALGFSDGDRQWIVTAYTLAFGGLLLLAGRVADLVGRKRTLIIGLVGFALASALGGAAQSFGIGGALTEYLSWRWCLYINIAIAIPAGFGALALLHDQAGTANPKLD